MGEGREALCPFPHTSPSYVASDLAVQSYSLRYHFVAQICNSKQLFLGSVSCFQKTIRSQEEVTEKWPNSIDEVGQSQGDNLTCKFLVF